jgi:hypothetical protein
LLVPETIRKLAQQNYRGRELNRNETAEQAAGGAIWRFFGFSLKRTL